MKRKRVLWSIPLCVVILISFTDPQWIVGWSENSGTSQDSQDMLVPAFRNSDVERGLTGTVKYRVELNNGKVIHIEEIYSDLKFTTTDTDYPILLEAPKDRVKSSIRRLRSMIVSPLSVEVVAEYLIDPTLPPNVRNYRIEIGGSGIPSRIVISGPLLQKNLKP